MQINLQEAKFRLSALGKRAWAGERIIIALKGEPYLELTPIEKRRNSGDRDASKEKSR